MQVESPSALADLKLVSGKRLRGYMLHVCQQPLRKQTTQLGFLQVQDRGKIHLAHNHGCDWPLGCEYISSLYLVRGPSDTAQILRPSGTLRSLTHIAIVDGFEANPANLRGLRIGIDASIWFFHAAHGREGENPELRTLFFRCAKLASTPFLPLFIFDGPKCPKVKRGRRISGEKHWLVDSMKGIIEAFGFEWRMVCSIVFPY